MSILHRESILFGLYCEEPVAKNACTTDNMSSNYTARTLADLFSNFALHVIDAGEPRTCPAFGKFCWLQVANCMLLNAKTSSL